LAAGGGKGPTPAPMQHDDRQAVKKLEKQQITPRTPANKQVPLFHHLPQYEREESLSVAAVAKGNVHPAVLRLGLQMAEGIVHGSNSRVVEMLRAFQIVVSDFTCPPSKVLSRELEIHLSKQIQYMIDCRPQSMAMGNATKWLKMRVGHLPPHLSNDRAKALLCSQIDTFIEERITLADKAILSYAESHIASSDVVLVYGGSQVIETLLLHSHTLGAQFRVVVADSGPKFEGREMLGRLVEAGLRCTYANLHALSYVMPEVNKVLLGASSMLLNGNLVSRAGTALVAMLAHEHGVPVLVCCETYKFAERVLLDSICYNELGDPDELVPREGDSSKIADWRDMPRLKLLNLVYDVTPMKYLTMVVTEAGVVPPTSVPVIIREDAARMALQAQEVV